MLPFDITFCSEYLKVSVKMISTLCTEVMCLPTVYNCCGDINLFLKIKLKIVLEAVVNLELEKQMLSALLEEDFREHGAVGLQSLSTRWPQPLPISGQPQIN